MVEERRQGPPQGEEEAKSEAMIGEAQRTRQLATLQTQLARFCLGPAL